MGNENKKGISRGYIYTSYIRIIFTHQTKTESNLTQHNKDKHSAKFIAFSARYNLMCLKMFVNHVHRRVYNLSRLHAASACDDGS